MKGKPIQFRGPSRASTAWQLRRHAAAKARRKRREAGHQELLQLRDFSEEREILRFLQNASMVARSSNRAFIETTSRPCILKYHTIAFGSLGFRLQASFI